MPSRSMKPVDDLALLRLVDDAGARDSCGSSASVMFSRTDMLGHDALGLAVLGAEAHPGRGWRRPASAKRGVLAAEARSCRRPAGRPPNTARAVSVRPEPSRPARPTISPARTSRPTRRAPGGRPGDVGAQQLARRSRARAVRRRWRPRPGPSARSRPSMAATSCSLVDLGHRRRRATVRPSRMTVTRSQTA